MKKFLLGTVAFVALSTVGAAYAADMPVKAPPLIPVVENAILRANNQVTLDFIYTYDKYGPEYISGVGAPLDLEQGGVPGLSVTGSVMRDIAGFQNVYLWGRFSYMNGNTQYVGASGGGAFGSLVNKDGATIWNWDFRIGKGFSVAPNVMLTPYFGIGSNAWNRLLIGAGGYNELYSHDYAGAGLLAQWSPAARWVLSAYGLVGGAFNSKETSTDTPGGFPIPPWTFILGNNTTYMAGASADYAFTEHWHANAGFDWTYFSYGQSAVNPFGYLEPNSLTRYWTWSAGIGYSW